MIPIIRKFDIGRLPICKSCGRFIQAPPNTVECCGDQKIISLRRYVEEVRNETFDPTEWTYDVTNRGYGSCHV